MYTVTITSFLSKVLKFYIGEKTASSVSKLEIHMPEKETRAPSLSMSESNSKGTLK